MAYCNCIVNFDVACKQDITSEDKRQLIFTGDLLLV